MRLWTSQQFCPNQFISDFHQMRVVVFPELGRGNHHESLLFVVTCCNQQPSHLPFGHCIPVALRLSGVETAVKH